MSEDQQKAMNFKCCKCGKVYSLDSGHWDIEHKGKQIIMSPICPECTEE